MRNGVEGGAHIQKDENVEKTRVSLKYKTHTRGSGHMRPKHKPNTAHEPKRSIVLVSSRQMRRWTELKQTVLQRNAQIQV